MIESISAITLATHDLERGMAFYAALGFELTWHRGGFATFRGGRAYVNLIRAADDVQWAWWGRVIINVSDVDEMYQRALAAGLTPQFPPRDAEWGERYFHLRDPDGHELSFAKRLPGGS